MKIFAVADMPCIERLLGSLDNRINRDFGYDNLHLDLGQQRDLDLCAAVIFRRAVLRAEPADVRDRHTVNAN